MSILTQTLVVWVLLIPTLALAKEDSISPAMEKNLAAMAAKDWGHSLDDPNNSLRDLNNTDGTEMYDGYYNIAIMVNPDVPVGTVYASDLAMNLAIRKATADVVEMNTCRVLRYPDLMAFRRDWLKKTGNKPVSLDQIQNEVDCELKVVSKPQHK